MRGVSVLVVLILAFGFAGTSRAEYPIYDCAEYADEDQMTPVPKPTVPRTPLPAEEPLS
jgi:hypothetical protein